MLGPSYKESVARKYEAPGHRHRRIRKSPQVPRGALSWEPWSQQVRVQLCGSWEGHTVGLGQGRLISGPVNWSWAGRRGLNSGNKAEPRYLKGMGDR